MAHISIDTIRARLAGTMTVAKSLEADLQVPEQSPEESLTQGVQDGGTNEQAPEQSAEESLQPLGGDAGAMSGELAGSDGADAEQTDTTDDAAGSSPDETQAKPKNRAK